jgi:hypothetical protein
MSNTRSRVRPELVPGEWEVQSLIVCSGTGRTRCEACGRVIRYIHCLKHKETAKVLDVGIECCGALTGDFDLAQRLQNEGKRKMGWREHYGDRPFWKQCTVKPTDLEGR